MNNKKQNENDLLTQAMRIFLENYDGNFYTIKADFEKWMENYTQKFNYFLDCLELSPSLTYNFLKNTPEMVMEYEEYSAKVQEDHAKNEPAKIARFKQEAEEIKRKWAKYKELNEDAKEFRKEENGY